MCIDDGTWDVHGVEDGRDTVLVACGKVFFEDVLFFCDGEEGKDSTASIVDDADEEGNIFLLEGKKAGEVVECSEITDDEYTCFLGGVCPACSTCHDAVDPAGSSVYSTSYPVVMGWGESIEVSNGKAVG